MRALFVGLLLLIGCDESRRVVINAPGMCPAGELRVCVDNGVTGVGRRVDCSCEAQDGGVK